MYDQILVPTDGSDGTRGAVDHAIDLAATYDATLHTIYVVDTNVVSRHRSSVRSKRSKRPVRPRSIE
jgi:nucleotide-binding universal stress UspA family protein